MRERIKPSFSSSTQSNYQFSVGTTGKNMLVAYLFWWFLGSVGAHRFYLNRSGSAIVMIILACLGFVTFFIAWIPLGLWWLIDGYFVYKYVTEANAATNTPSLGFSLMTNKQSPSDQAETDIGVKNQKLEALERLAKLNESGAITDAEFAAEKRKLLDCI